MTYSSFLRFSSEFIWFSLFRLLFGEARYYGYWCAIERNTSIRYTEGITWNYQKKWYVYLHDKWLNSNFQLDLYKDACIDTEYKPSCINLITNEPNMRVKITSGYNRGINLSKLIRIYTKFDSRVVKILRLFRILAKVC
jgi:hypothetical protein